jgi:hypothetical protein
VSRPARRSNVVAHRSKNRGQTAPVLLHHGGEISTANHRVTLLKRQHPLGGFQLWDGPHRLSLVGQKSSNNLLTKHQQPGENKRQNSTPKCPQDPALSCSCLLWVTLVSPCIRLITRRSLVQIQTSLPSKNKGLALSLPLFILILQNLLAVF